MGLHNLILTGGINHDYENTANALAEVLLDIDMTSEIYLDIDEGFARLDEGSFDLVTLPALRWRMLDDDKYIPFRETWQYEISARDRNNLASHVAGGKGLLGLHTAAICFDTWDTWPSLLGAQWQWGKTFHPPPETFTVTPCADDADDTASILAGLNPFEVTDEIYHHLSAQPGTQPLLTAQSTLDHSTQTLAWAHRFQGGRVIYSALGHDRSSVTTPGHRDFLQRAARWCTGAIT